MTLYKSLTVKRDGNPTILYVMLRDGGCFILVDYLQTLHFRFRYYLFWVS
jgi:hypothetical protein